MDSSQCGQPQPLGRKKLNNLFNQQDIDAEQLRRVCFTIKEAPQNFSQHHITILQQRLFKTRNFVFLDLLALIINFTVNEYVMVNNYNGPAEHLPQVPPDFFEQPMQLAQYLQLLLLNNQLQLSSEVIGQTGIYDMKSAVEYQNIANDSLLAIKDDIVYQLYNNPNDLDLAKIESFSVQILEALADNASYITANNLSCILTATMGRYQTDPFVFTAVNAILSNHQIQEADFLPNEQFVGQVATCVQHFCANNSEVITVYKQRAQERIGSLVTLFQAASTTCVKAMVAEISNSYEEVLQNCMLQDFYANMASFACVFGLDNIVESLLTFNQQNRAHFSKAFCTISQYYRQKLGAIVTQVENGQLQADEQLLDSFGRLFGSFKSFVSCCQSYTLSQAKDIAYAYMELLSARQFRSVLQQNMGILDTLASYIASYRDEEFAADWESFGTYVYA